MELTQIRYFLHVAKTLHITKSAQELNIAQPALTQSIHRLEDSLGVPLFAPKGRNIVLTQYGEYFMQTLEPIMKRIDEIPAELQRIAKVDNETIHLNVLASSSLVTEAIIEYKKIRKNINFQFFQNSDSGVFDVEITTKSYNEKEEATGRKFVCDEKIFVALPSEKFKNEKSVSLHDLNDEGFIRLLGSKQFRFICDKFCRHIAFRPNVIFESDNFISVKNMIAANVGVGFWPEFTWGEIENDKVFLAEIKDEQFLRNIVISYNENKANNKNVVDFFEFLKEYFLKTRKSIREKRNIF